MTGLLAVIAFISLSTAAYWFWFFHRPPPATVRRGLFRGIHYAREVRSAPRPLVVHVVTIDLTTPGLRFRVTPGDAGSKPLPLTAQTTSGFLRETGAQVAINGDFFSPWRSNALWDYYPHVGDPVRVSGRACSNGNCYADDGRKRRLPSLFLTRHNRAYIGRNIPAGWQPYNVLSGNWLLLEAGKPAMSQGGELQPRTAVALDRTRRELLLFVVDGRQPGYSEGATIDELIQILREHGGHTAINLDGGGSCTLAAREAGGRVLVLNSPIDNRIPGRERPVANHLAVFASPLP